MLKILVTGATGLLGSRLVPHLRSRGYSVFTQARAGEVDVQFDLSKTGESFLNLDKLVPDIIINLVALTSVEECQDQVDLAYRSNVLTVENLVSWIHHSGGRCYFVHVSTDHVYGGDGPHAEDRVLPINAYALSKYAGELAAQRVSGVVFRTNFVGISNSEARVSFTDWLFRSLVSGTKIEVLSDVFFSPLALSKLVEIIDLALSKRLSGVFNLGSHAGGTKSEFAFGFAESLGLSTSNTISIQSEQAKFFKVNRPKDMRMICNKFEKVMKLKLPTFKETIVQVAKEYRDIT